MEINNSEQRWHDAQGVPNGKTPKLMSEIMKPQLLEGKFVSNLIF